MQRADRVAEAMRDELSAILRQEVRDPRLPPLVSVVEVRVSRDLSHARVFLSVLGDEAARKDAGTAIRSASGFIRRELSHRLRLRIAPELEFILDQSIERGIRLSGLIDETVRQDEARHRPGPDHQEPSATDRKE